MSDKDNNKNDLKKFFIKLVSITFAAIIAFNIIFNLIFSERLEKIDKALSLNEKENREQILNKLRSEVRKGIDKENLLNQDDRELLYKFYLKIKKEFDEIENK
tara:strand:+ start:846 stop:1154 length:309 start_codon:yes stop_codon:yes gene_type:complete